MNTYLVESGLAAGRQGYGMTVLALLQLAVECTPQVAEIATFRRLPVSQCVAKKFINFQ
ncbi:hypothetical protein LJR289_001851 [Pseudoduganella sp. LjRoot289]|uniref:hypothetical protein n=1 Tax=Pseudoduganella sp. LjRoot289 TaxID=3342314 RepID=UPI003ED10CA4